MRPAGERAGGCAPAASHSQHPTSRPPFPAFNDAGAVAGLSRSPLFLGDPPAHHAADPPLHHPTQSPSGIAARIKISRPRPERPAAPAIPFPSPFPPPASSVPRPPGGAGSARGRGGGEGGTAVCSGGRQLLLAWRCVLEELFRADVAALAVFTRTEWGRPRRQLVRRS